MVDWEEVVEIPIRAANDLNVLLGLAGVVAVVGRGGGTEEVDVVDEVGERGVEGLDAARRCICIIDVRAVEEGGGGSAVASILMSGLVG